MLKKIRESVELTLFVVGVLFLVGLAVSFVVVFVPLGLVLLNTIGLYKYKYWPVILVAATEVAFGNENEEAYCRIIAILVAVVSGVWVALIPTFLFGLTLAFLKYPVHPWMAVAALAMPITTVLYLRHLSQNPIIFLNPYPKDDRWYL